ncbi:DUF7024 domain-containing protein [Erwinia amylovora]|uniref:DUF7024 domain-containing protein n=1 Tax=Erwinia amylovora TaxID=552 RepID=UPI00352AC739
MSGTFILLAPDFRLSASLSRPVSNPTEARSIAFTPAQPIKTSEGTMDGFAARKPGIAPVSLRATPPP